VIAEILTIGDELLRGEIVDSNKAFLSERLLRLEVETHFQSSVRDDPADMRDAFLRARRAGPGGSVPPATTSTVEVLARSFGRELALHELLAAIRGFFARSAARWPRTTRQACAAGAEVREPRRTAPGCLLEVPREGGRARALLLPAKCREL
jgi:nicotinamide-nucleotide amidase